MYRSILGKCAEIVPRVDYTHSITSTFMALCVTDGDEGRCMGKVGCTCHPRGGTAHVEEIQ